MDKCWHSSPPGSWSVKCWRPAEPSLLASTPACPGSAPSPAKFQMMIQKIFVRIADRAQSSFPCACTDVLGLRPSDPDLPNPELATMHINQVCSQVLASCHRGGRGSLWSQRLARQGMTQASGRCTLTPTGMVASRMKNSNHIVHQDRPK